MLGNIFVSGSTKGLSQEDVRDNIVIQKTSTDNFTHTVLCEFGTYTSCKPCSDAAHVLHDLFEQGNLDFYYVSLVYDKYIEARNRLEKDYNIYGFPVSFFDGGYEVKAGKPTQSEYLELIESCSQRVVHNLSMNVTLNWLGDAVSDVYVNIENNENETYNGSLRAYIVEIISRWNDYNSNPYRYTFLDWAFNKNISIEAGDNYSDIVTWDGKEHGFGDINASNIMVIAVMFNNEWHQGYSFPPDTGPFDAYYVDETVASYFDNTPPDKPSIDGLTSGKAGKSYDYTFNTTDPEGDDIWYHICWGDKEIIYIIGPCHSGDPLTISYTWVEKGTYNISCKARDVYDEESDWAYLEVTMPKNRQTSNMFLLMWLERFPILQKILDFLRLNNLMNKP
jgi:hypothetical protein